MKDEAKKSILIIEDDEISRELLTDHLSELGFHVIVSEDGMKANQMLKTTIPNLILLDIMMPRMDGYTFLKKMKEANITSNIPIIIVSSLGSLDNVKKAISLGASDYITKPINLSKLNEKINKVLNLKLPTMNVLLRIDVSFTNGVFLLELNGTIHERDAVNIQRNILESISQYPKIKPPKIIIDIEGVAPESMTISSISALFEFYGAIDDIEPDCVKLVICKADVIQRIKEHPISKFFQIVSSKDEGFKLLKSV